MVGLPDETEQDILDTIEVINSCKCEGIKIHSTYVIEKTGLAELYNSGRYLLLSMEHYVDMVAKIVSRLNKDMIIHRINADPPKDKFIAPKWQLRKKIVLNSINQKLEVLDIVQGDRKY